MATAVETRRDVEGASKAASRPRLPGLFLGIGLGGSWMASSSTRSFSGTPMLTSEGDYSKNTVAGLETNTLWDGLFHAATWIAVASGVWVLWRRTTDWRWAISGRAFFGWLLVGWGLFNFVEGIVDHQILTIHHVREGADKTWLYDGGFLALGALLLVGGWLLTRSAEAPLIKPS
jgi:uncharacterized membrane protein